MEKKTQPLSALETDACARITALTDEKHQTKQKITEARDKLKSAIETKLRQVITRPDTHLLDALSGAIWPFQNAYEASLINMRRQMINDRKEGLAAIQSIPDYQGNGIATLHQTYAHELQALSEATSTTQKKIDRLKETHEDRELEARLKDLGINSARDIQNIKRRSDNFKARPAPQKPSWWQFFGKTVDAWHAYQAQSLAFNTTDHQLKGLEDAAIALFNKRQARKDLTQERIKQDHKRIDLNEKSQLLSEHYAAAQKTDATMCTELCSAATQALSSGLIKHVKAALDATHKVCPTLITPHMALLAAKEEKLTDLLKAIDLEIDQAKRLQSYGKNVRYTPALAARPAFQDAVRYNHAANRRSHAITQTRQRLERVEIVKNDNCLGVDLLGWATDMLILSVLYDKADAPPDALQGRGGTMAGAGASNSWDDAPNTAKAPTARMDMALVLGLNDIAKLDQLGLPTSEAERAAFQNIMADASLAIPEERSDQRHSSGRIGQDFGTLSTPPSRDGDAAPAFAASAPASIAPPASLPSVSLPSFSIGGWSD